MKILDADQTRSPLAFERLVPALREAFAREATVPPRHVHAVTAGEWQVDALLDATAYEAFSKNA